MLQQAGKAELPSRMIANLRQLASPCFAETSSPLIELLKARDYACDAQRDLWDFAVEIATLRQFGLTDTDLRWLVSKNYVEHRYDATESHDLGRRFDSAHPLKFRPESCFILTTTGSALLERLCTGHKDSPQPPLTDEPRANSKTPVPTWDNHRRQLTVSEYLVKYFRWPAPNQEAVLAAFQEEGWARRVDDPLSPADGQEPKQRLHDTIKCLNKRQRIRLIQFSGDGTGEGVIWRYTRIAGALQGIRAPEDDDDSLRKYG